MPTTSKTFADVPVATLLRRFKEAETSRKNKYEENWTKAKQYYDGKFWQGVTKAAWYMSEPGYNKPFEFVEIMRSYLSDSMWGIDVYPSVLPELVAEAKFGTAADGQSNALSDQLIEDMTERINKLLDFTFIDQRMQNKLAQVLLYVFLYGTGFIKCSWNPNSIDNTGIGQIETVVLSPRYIFPDPDATDMHDASYIIEHHPVTFRWIIERYPEMAEEVKKKGITSTSIHYEGKGSREAGAPDPQEAQRVDVYECYYNDATIIEDEATLSVKSAYPNGRMTLMTSTGVVLDDKPNPYTMFPYVRFIEIPRPAEFFGDCTLWRSFPIVDTIHQLLRSIIDNGMWMVNGIWVVDSTSGVTPKKMSGYAPRDTVVKNTGTEVRREVGQGLPSSIFETLNDQIDAFDRVVGLPDVLRGIVPSRQPVGTVQMQKEAGDIRTRERQRRVEESLQDLAKLWLSIMVEFMPDKRTFHNKKMLGGFDMFQLTKKDLEEWQWNVQVVQGSTSPSDAGDQLDKALRLVTEGGVVFPPEYLATLARLPGAHAALLAGQAQAAAMPTDGVQPAGDPLAEMTGGDPNAPLDGTTPNAEADMAQAAQQIASAAPDGDGADSEAVGTDVGV